MCVLGQSLKLDVLDSVEHGKDSCCSKAVRAPARGTGLIAATARATNRIVVTADDSAFDDLPGVLFETYQPCVPSTDTLARLETGPVAGHPEGWGTPAWSNHPAGMIPGDKRCLGYRKSRCHRKRLLEPLMSRRRNSGASSRS